VDLIVLQQLAVSFGLGLLLGLERERTESSIGGIRTFPLIALFGTICALLGQSFGGWLVAAGLLALVAIVVCSNFAKMKSGDIDPGMTTEVAALLLYGLGAYVVIGSMVVAVVVGGAMTVLLQFKKPLHTLAGAIGERDMPGDYAVRSGIARDSAGAATTGFRAIRRLEPFPNMAHGRAHRWHQPHWLHRLQVSRRQDNRPSTGGRGSQEREGSRSGRQAFS
jgi:hypothetical protein